MNKFNKVIDYIYSNFNDKVKMEDENKVIIYGNFIFYNSDPIDNRRQLNTFKLNIDKICEKCVDIIDRGIKPLIYSDTPTPTPSPSSSSITNSTITTTDENKYKFKDEPKVMQMSDILPNETVFYIYIYIYNIQQKSGKDEIVRYKLDYSYCKFNSDSKYYLYKLSCISENNTNVCKYNYGIISQSEEDINYNFQFVYNNHNYNGNWSFCKSIELNKTEISCLKDYTKNILNSYNCNSCNYDFTIGKQYYICKMNEKNNILFYEMSLFKNAFDQFQNKVSIPVVNRNESDKLLYHIKNGEDCKNWIISHESLNFIDPTSESLYKVVEVTSMSPYYRIQDSAFDDETSFSDIYFNKYNIISEEDQTLVKCVLLSSNNNSNGYCNSSNGYAYFLPQFCTVCYGNCDEYKFICFLPSVAYEYEYATRFSQFKKKILKTKTEYAMNDVNMIVNCLTPYLYNEDYNYEKYSNLGNSLTKYLLSLSLYYQYSTESASLLSSKRSELFTKKNIKEIAENLKLYEYIFIIIIYNYLEL